MEGHPRTACTLRAALPAVVAGLAITLGAGAGPRPLHAQPELLRQCDVLRVDMRAYPLDGDAAGGAVRYRGLHTQDLQGTVHRVEQRFTTPSGETVARVSARYRADNLTPVAFRLQLPKLGRLEVLERLNGAATVRVREQAGAEPETGQVIVTDDTLFAPSLIVHIVRQWDTLMAGETLRFPLLVPSRAARYPFRIRREAPSPAGGAGRTVLRMEPTELLVQQVVEPIRFVFESKPPHRLLEYRGRSPIRGTDGEVQNLRITYHYRDTC